MPRLTPPHALAFSLSELLVSLAVLGLISAFAVPKVIQVTNENSLRSTYRTTISALQKVVSNGMFNADFNELANFNVANQTDGLSTYFTNQFNATPCEAGNTTNVNCQMQWGAGATAPSLVTGSSARWILPSGARVWIPQALGADGLLRFRIDARLEGPSSNDSTLGDLPDLLELTCNLNDATIAFAIPIANYPLKPGECKPSDANNQAIYEAIYND
jgi:type II secretory pathway pseudopilin PulG